MNMNKRATELNHRARVRAGSNRPRESVELDPAEAEASASPPPMDSGLGCTGWTGSGGGAGSRDNLYTVSGGGASAAAWTRLVSSGLEDELVGVAGAGGGRAGALSPPQLPQGHFLDACFLCRKPLASNRDIFMYRGDMPFCTEECRREQIEMDEKLERKETTSKKVAQRASSPKDVESSPRPPKARAGSILAG